MDVGSVTTKSKLPPSVTVGLLTEVISLSTIVAKPVAEAFAVVPTVVVANKLKSSFASVVGAFSRIGVRTNMLVTPAAKVAEATLADHVAPPSKDTCVALVKSTPKVAAKALGPAAEPAKASKTVVAVLLGADNVKVNMAKLVAFSETITLLTLNVGAASSSLMVPKPVCPPIVKL